MELSSMHSSKGGLKYHFVGIGGVGMSALAQIMKAQGHWVSGSDRRNDLGQTPEIFYKLKLQGIKLYPQDGSGVCDSTDTVVISSAIEEDNRDQKKAFEKDVRIVKRSELLSNLFNCKRGIAIGGSNGKTTVCGMVGWILSTAGHDPTVVGGGYLKNYITDMSLGNARFGDSNIFVIEADESDGSLVDYEPNVSVITDVSKDHKTVDELKNLFSRFAENTSDTVIMNDKCAHLIRVHGKKKIITYGDSNSADVHLSKISCGPYGSRFETGGCKFELQIPGSYNVLNALAAISVAQNEGISDSEIRKALGSFNGIRRRMEFVGVKNGVKIIDDYAHNPKKIQMAIDAARLNGGSLIVIFQSHGYAPTKFLRDDIISTFAATLLPADILYMPEIFYAGGTADKTISSKDIIDDLKEKGYNAFFFQKREDIISDVQRKVRSGNTILVMGARDDSLTDFCHSLLNEL